MELKEKQVEFARLVPRLIDKAFEFGYTVTLGECLRPPEMAAIYAKQGKGINGSLHTLKLAIDINLFRNGVYLTDTESHRMLGTWWEAQSAGKDFVTAWGGHWGDGNHYSIAHGGKK